MYKTENNNLGFPLRLLIPVGDVVAYVMIVCIVFIAYYKVKNIQLNAVVTWCTKGSVAHNTKKKKLKGTPILAQPNAHTDATK